MYPLCDAVEAHRIWKAARHRKAAAPCRLIAARHPVGELKIDALLDLRATERSYLSGFTGDNGLLLVTPTRSLFTDPRFTIQAAGECSCEVKTVTKTPLDQAALQMVGKAHQACGI